VADDVGSSWYRLTSNRQVLSAGPVGARNQSGENNVKRILGRSGIEASAVGMGCWAIGGPWEMMGSQAGWGVVDDAESTRAIHAAMELGVNFFDTAGTTARSQRAGPRRGAQGRRTGAIIATKFGYEMDETGRKVTPFGQPRKKATSPATFGRTWRQPAPLGTDYIDVLPAPRWGLSSIRCRRDGAGRPVAEGRVRTYGWSTIGPMPSKPSRPAPVCGVVEQESTSLRQSRPLLALAERLNLASINVPARHGSSGRQDHSADHVPR